MLMICKATSLGKLCLMNMIFFVPQVLMRIPIYDDYISESGFGRVSTLGSNEPTILEDIEPYFDNYKS